MYCSHFLFDIQTESTKNNMELCLCPGLRSTMDEEREAGRSGEEVQERAASPASSCDSFKSAHSMGQPAEFKDEDQSIEKR